MPKFKEFVRRIMTKKKESKVVERLLETIEVLEKKSEFLAKRIEDAERCASRNRVINKPAAIEALRRKRRYEKQLQGVLGVLNTVKFQVESLHNARLNRHVLNTLQHGARENKRAQKYLSPEGVSSVLDEISDQKELSDEIENLFNHANINENLVEEDELFTELEELEKENLDEKLIPIPSVEELANLSINSEASEYKQSRDADDVKKLEAWADCE